MEINDLEPINQKPPEKNLDVMSIEALGEYIEELELEITRVRNAITGKKTARDEATSAFKR